MRRPIPSAEDPDVTLNQAAHMLTKKSSGGRRKPLPPKRTSSFRDHSQPGSVGSSNKDVSFPDTVMESDGSMDHLDRTPEDHMEDMDNSDREYRYHGNDANKSRSSSEELLSTPASQSRSGSMERSGGTCGSMERVPEHSPLAAEPQRSRSSSRERSLSESSPAKTRSSSDQKTPDTDASDAACHSLPIMNLNFPPPPPPIAANSPIMGTEMSCQTPRSFYKPKMPPQQQPPSVSKILIEKMIKSI